MAGNMKSNFEPLEVSLAVHFKDAVLKNRFEDFAKSVRASYGTLPENDVRNSVELAVRQVLLGLLGSKTIIKILDRVFQFSIDAAIHDMCFGNLPVLVLSDMFDGSTLSECEVIFNFVESRVETFKKDIFFKNCKNHLLRSCNDLLRRLSRSQNTVFCGRILLFLARIFPLSERSGLNIISEFNFDNTTIYNSKEEPIDSSLDKDEPMEEGEIIARPFTADYRLYRKFWPLQDFFRNPNTCYNKMQWRHFTSYSAEILTVFGNFKSDDANFSKWKQTEGSSAGGNFAYFAKYLTSPKLLELQLSDSNFRRYLLVQFLILFQYLSSPVKFKLESYVLSDEQQVWVKETTARVYKLLELTPPDGPQFSRSIAKVLKREEYWNTWKNEGCPDFKTVEYYIDQKQTRSRKRMSDELNESNKILVGSTELTKLWNVCPDNWEACKAPRRRFMPTMEKFFENAIQQADPDSQVESQYKDVSDPKFAWRALRLLSRKSPNFFTASTSNAQYKNLPQYLEAVIQKIPKETTADQEMTTAEQDTPSVAEETIDEGNEEILHTSEEDSRDEVEKAKRTNIVTKQIVESLSAIEKIQSNWKALAKYLDFKPDEISYFEETYTSPKEQAEKVVMVWMEQDALGGSLTTLKCALQNSGLLDVASHIFSSP